MHKTVPEPLMTTPRSDRARTQFERFDYLLNSRSSWVVLALLLAGFLVRCALASLPPLDADEATYYLIGRLPQFADTWREFQTQAHPPLFFLIVRYWEMLGWSELYLRTLPVAAGIFAAFMAWKWISVLFSSRSAGFIALVFGVFSPFLIDLSVELRQYSLLLFFAFSALYFFEVGRYRVSALCCSAAVLTHYSALFLLPYFPLLLGIRFCLAPRRDPRGFFRACTPLIVPAAIFVTLYVWHIRRINGSEMTRRAKQEWLSEGYFHPARDRFITFFPSHIYAMTQVQYTVPIISIRRGDRNLRWKVLLIATVLFVGITALGFRLTRETAIQLLLYGAAAFIMFLILGLASVAGYYPFSNSRHTSIFFVFTLPIVCLVLSRLCSNRAGVSLVVSVVVAGGMLAYQGSLTALRHSDSRQTHMRMMAALLKSRTAPGDVIFASQASGMVMQYYLQNRPVTMDFNEPPAGLFNEYSWSGVHVICSSVFGWSSAAALFEQLDKVRAQQHLGDSVWVVLSDWSPSLESEIDANRLRPVEWIMRRKEGPEAFRPILSAR